MEEYISYLDIPHHWGLEKGDVVLLQSDVMQLTLTSLHNGERLDRNKFIDAILDVIGPEGTLLIPTFNWDFCHAVAFDYQKTPCKTGSLGTIALRRKDFQRTQHPLYSFAVAGKDQQLLVEMQNESSFGADSPFGYLERKGGKNVLIDLHYTDTFTYVHHVEEICGVNTYRFQKTFTAPYIDKDGNTSERSYSMLVRDYDRYQETDLTGIGERMEEAGCAKVFKLNGVTYRVVDLKACTPVIKDDIENNHSRGICKHTGQ